MSAKTHFSKGTRLYEVGDYRQALDEFKAAHLAKPDSAFLYNIAQCHRQLGELEQAVTLYKRFLSTSPNAANHVEVERRVADLEAELAARKQREAVVAPVVPPVVSPPEPSTPAPTTPAPTTLPQPAPPVAASPGVTVQPVAIATAAQPRPAGASLRYLRWVGVGVTLGLVAGAITSGVLAQSKYDDLKKTCGATSVGCSDSSINGVKSRALLTNVLWGVAGVAAVGTGVTFYLAPHESAVQVAWRF